MNDVSSEGEVLPPEIIRQNPEDIEKAEKALIDELTGGKGKKYVRFVMAALGSIPWVGSFLSILGAAGGLWGETEQEKLNSLQKLWIEEHRQKLNELGKTLDEIFTRLDGFGDEVQKRIESKEYLTTSVKSDPKNITNAYRVQEI